MPSPHLPLSGGQVRRRTVFYLSGFDPKGAGHYHALYKDEAQKQAQVSCMQIDVSRRRKTPHGDSFWNISAQTPDGSVETRYEFLHWDDIVRRHWPRHQGRVIRDIVATTLLNLRHGVLWRMLKLSWPPAVALFAPFVLLCLMLFGAPILAMLVFSTTNPLLGAWVAIALSMAGVAGWLQLGLWLQQKYSMLWLMRSYAFTALQAKGQVPELDLRLNQHAQTVLNRIAEAVDDEVLIVGHSSGAIMAASLLARALHVNPQLGCASPVISLLTLGHCIPMLGCLPQAQSFRDDLRLLATSQGIEWIDFTAPPDGCCFALVDPLASCGINESARFPDRPKLLSPRFAEMFNPADYQAIRRDKFRTHFQYLMATGQRTSYDYFAITAGGQALAKRFAEHQSVNNFTKLQIF
jgi:hypothetical protein